MTTPHSVSSTTKRSENYSNLTSSKNRLFYSNILYYRTKLEKSREKVENEEIFDSATLTEGSLQADAPIV
jgi:hypothetical protein